MNDRGAAAGWMDVSTRRTHSLSEIREGKKKKKEKKGAVAVVVSFLTEHRASRHIFAVVLGESCSRCSADGNGQRGLGSAKLTHARASHGCVLLT